MEKNTPIKISVSIGELIDKITILQIKTTAIKDIVKIKHIEKELEELFYIYNNKLSTNNKCQEYKDELLITNKKLWKIEDDIRECERIKDFGDTFIKLARSVYYENDKRFEIKNKINVLYNSNIVEVKSYKVYQMSKFLIFTLLYTLGGILIWTQTNGQFLWTSFEKNPLAISLTFGVTISYIMISATKYGFLSLNGSLWSIQFIGFSLGLIVNTILNYYLMNEGINIKTTISILLALCIITIQFWK